MIDVEWARFVARLVAGRKQVEVAHLSGISQSTLSRWLKGEGGMPTMETAVAFARACEANPIEALVVLDVLRAEDFEDPAVMRMPVSLSDVTDAELAAEVRRRLVESREA